MEFILIFGITILFIGLFYLIPVIRSRNPKNLCATVGTLSKTSSFKNFQTRYGLFKNLTDFTYTYSVNGKSYRISGSAPKHRRFIPNKVDIVYLKGFPRSAYIEEYTGVIEWLLSISFSIMGAILLAIYFIQTH